MFRGRNTLTYQNTAVFWREVLSAHNRKFHGCSSFQLLTKRLWPRAVPWARIKILSDEIVSANRLAYPSGRRDQSEDPREKATTKERSSETTRRKRDVFCGALKCAQGEEFENPLFSKKEIERGNASARLDRNAPSTVRHVIGILFRGERPPPQISQKISSRLVPPSFYCEDPMEYRKIYEYVSCRGVEMSKNEIKPNRV